MCGAILPCTSRSKILNMQDAKNMGYKVPVLEDRDNVAELPTDLTDLFLENSSTWREGRSDTKNCGASAINVDVQVEEIHERQFGGSGSHTVFRSGLRMRTVEPRSTNGLEGEGVGERRGGSDKKM